jgi:Region found in RelA / SpoT proteins
MAVRHDVPITIYSTADSDLISRAEIRLGEAFPFRQRFGAVSNFPQFDYSMRDVRRAGDALRGDLIWNDETADSIREIFKIANNWRDSHAFPMRSLRYELIGQIRRQQFSGQTAARLKRMPSVRRKLRKISANLNQIQDLAGCRAILPSIKEVNAVVDGLRANSAHDFHNEADYINKPKPDGYRSHHMVFKFKGIGEEAVFDGRRVEIQVRSHLQHSWATAVEAVGMFRREDLKGGQGDADWLRLFQLTSAEIALAEGCHDAAGPDARSDRVREIIALEKKLRAVGTLEDTAQGVRYVDEYVTDANYKPEYFLIKYNRANGTVSVEPYSEPISGMKSLDAEEVTNSERGDRNINAVLVEADSIENLKAAYPNYFGDVQIFKGILQKIAKGVSAQEFALPPQAAAPKKPYEKPDLSWFKRKRFPGPKGG